MTTAHSDGATRLPGIPLGASGLSVELSVLPRRIPVWRREGGREGRAVVEQDVEPVPCSGGWHTGREAWQEPMSPTPSWHPSHSRTKAAKSKGETRAL